MWEKITRKLCSRKLWVALAGFLTAILVAFAVPAESISQVTAIISAFGSLVAYILAEGYIDASHKDVGNDDKSE